MKIKSILLALIFTMVGFAGLSAVLQDHLSRGLIEEAAATQEALIKTGALVDEVRMLQIDFKWQVQAFKDVLLRGKDPELLARYRSEYESNLNKVTAEIEKVSGQMQSAEYGPVADSIKRLAEDHKAVSLKYSDAIELYTKLIGEKKSGGDGLAADVAVRGIDRELTADIDKIATFVRQRNEATAQAAMVAALKMHGEVSTKLYLVAGLLIMMMAAAGIFAVRQIMTVLGSEPVVLRAVAEKISNGDLTTTIASHDPDDESSLTAQLLLMQMKMRSLVIGINEEAKGALDRARGGAGMEDIINDLRALSKSMRKFKTGTAAEEAQ